MKHSIFKFCPNCKSENHAFTNHHKFVCRDCSFQYFHNIAGAVMVFLKHKDEVLFVRRNKEPKKALLDLPGGFIDPKENGQEAAVREIKEELNLSINASDLIIQHTESNDYTYKNILYYTVDIVFFLNFNNKPSIEFCKDELQETIWLNPKDLDQNDLAFESAKKIIQHLF